jgi:hypothetical protein
VRVRSEAARAASGLLVAQPRVVAVVAAVGRHRTVEAVVVGRAVIAGVVERRSPVAVGAGAVAVGDG